MSQNLKNLLNKFRSRKNIVRFIAFFLLKKAIWVGLFLFFSNFTFAQLIQVPLNYSQKNTKQAAQSQNSNAKVQKVQALNLPFFEDFSTSQYVPDVANWQAGGHTFINNTFAIKPPTKNFASFDGLRDDGIPHNLGSPNSYGLADSLISQPIDMSALTAADNVYISFFWQPEGLVEMPNPGDSIILQCKDINNTWITIWLQDGGLPVQDFKQEIIQLTNPNFFHADFQLRFQNYSRLSGAYDSWHIDYVYLNKDRNANDLWQKDVAVVSSPSSYLKRYTAMPVEQYFADPVGETAALIHTSLSNLFNNFTAITYNDVTFKNILTDPDTDLGNTTTNGGNLINAGEDSLPINTIPIVLVPTTDPMILQYTFDINSGDNNLPVDFSINDTIIGTTYLTDFYAYDDGTAEYGVGVNQKAGRVAYEFNLNQPATLTDIRINFVYLSKNLVGQTFLLNVWKDLESPPLFIKSFAIEYPDKLNGFINFSLENFAVPLDGKFYIGWQQTTDDLLAVGFDKNHDTGNLIFYNTNNEWKPNTDQKGSILIRPVFGDPPLGLNDDYEVKVEVFPNPTNEVVFLKGEKIKEVHLWNTLGQEVQVVNWNVASQKITCSNLPKGLYFLHLINYQQQKVVKKILIH